MSGWDESGLLRLAAELVVGETRQRLRSSET